MSGRCDGGEDNLHTRILRIYSPIVYLLPRVHRQDKPRKKEKESIYSAGKKKEKRKDRYEKAKLA